MTEKRTHSISRKAFLESAAIAPALGLAALAGPGEARAGEPDPAFADHPRVKRDWDKDGRSKKVVFLAHCAINQNARHENCADFPAHMDELLDWLQANGIGIVQLPCPEFMALGLGRDRDEPPQETIRAALELPEGQRRLERLTEPVIFMLQEYRWQGLQVLGILGKNGSPSCGVETTSKGGSFGPGAGVFVEALKAALEKHGIDTPVKGIDDHRQNESIEWLKERL